MYINYHTAISLILFLYKITIILNLIKKMELKSLNNKFPKEKNDNLNYSILESETKKYILLEKIGSGATSKIYKGYNELDTEKKIYAFKIIKQEKLLEASTNIIKNEISSLQKLQHPNIIKIYENDFGILIKKNKKKSKKVFYIKIEYLPNGSLFDYIYETKKPFTENQSKIIIKTLIETLNYIHENNYCHRDLKPENIMLDENYNLKIVDFGFAEKLNINLNGKLNSIIGTPSYSSPELLLKKSYYGISNDIFAIGVIMFILVTGKMPFKIAIKDDIHYNLIINNQIEKFWECKNVNLSNEFKILFFSLINFDYTLRPSLSEMKLCKWISDFCLNDVNELNCEFKQRHNFILIKKNKIQNIFINNCINFNKYIKDIVVNRDNSFEYKQKNFIIGNKTSRNDKKKNIFIIEKINKKQKIEKKVNINNNNIKLFFNNDSNQSDLPSTLSQLLK